MNTEPKRLGYARVSTVGQNLDSQMDDLRRANCFTVYQEKLSGVSDNRPEWERLLSEAKEGDTIVITELSRMTRSLQHLLKIVQELKTRGIQIESLREKIDTNSATGKAFISIMGAINELERELKAERAAAGRAAAKARGKTGGRPRTDPKKLEQAKTLYENSEQTAAEVCKAMGTGRRVFFEYLKKCRESEASANSANQTESE